MSSSRKRVVAVSCMLFCLPAACSRPEPADTIVHAARIYTLAGPAPTRVEDEPAVEALAIRGGVIVAAGDKRSVQRFAGRATRLEVWDNATVLPGFVDCHMHLTNVGRWLIEVDLIGTASWEEVVQRVVARARELPPGTWIRGRGWDQNDWPVPAFPEHDALSRAVPDHPVWLVRVDGHAGVANARALAEAGVGPATADPTGGRIHHKPDGTPTGVCIDFAMELIESRIPAADATLRRERLRRAMQHASRAGLTTVHDAGTSAADLAELVALQAAGAMPLRVYAMWDAQPEADAETVEAAMGTPPQPWSPSTRLAIQCVKFSADGALGSRGAALLLPYADAPGETGLPQYTLDEFLARARPFHIAGYQLATHAIGDAANRMVLDAYATLQLETPRPGARHRVEHAQVLAANDIPRFAAEGVVASMQPTHCTSDMPWVPERLGSARLAGAYAWRSLVATGAAFAAGSDAPVERIEPLVGIFAAVTRQAPDGQPPGGWSPEERLTRSEALRAYTSWAAYVGFAETWVGTLEPGKRADFVVLDRDLLRCSAEEILTTRVLRTFVDGRDAASGAGPDAPTDSLRARAIRIPTH